MTLRWRLTLAFVLVVLVPLAVGAVLVARAFPSSIAHRQQAALYAKNPEEAHKRPAKGG